MFFKKKKKRYRQVGLGHEPFEIPEPRKLKKKVFIPADTQFKPGGIVHLEPLDLTNQYPIYALKEDACSEEKDKRA